MLAPDLSRIDPYARRQRGVTVEHLFPTRPGECACGCGVALSGRRTRWASDACSRAAVGVALLHFGDPNVIRARVFERDGGTCALCGFDTDRARRLLDRLTALSTEGPVQRARRGRVLAYLVGLGYPARTLRHWQMETRDIRRAHGWGDMVVYVETVGPDNPRRSLWDADHILPVQHGGGGCGLNGFRTLCVPCHIGVTAMSRRVLAA